jgi:hypothetical protein
MEKFIGPILGATFLALAFWGVAPREQRVQPVTAPAAPSVADLAAEDAARFQELREMVSRNRVLKAQWAVDAALDDARWAAIEEARAAAWAAAPSEGGKDQ